jgi:hypothetical protein
MGGNLDLGASNLFELFGKAGVESSQTEIGDAHNWLKGKNAIVIQSKASHYRRHRLCRQCAARRLGV